MKSENVKNSTWYSYKASNGELAYVYISNARTYSSGSMGNRFLDPDYDSNEPRKSYNLGLEELKLTEVKNFNKFKKDLLKRGYITFEKSSDCEYRNLKYTIINLDHIRRYPEAAIIETESKDRHLRFIKDVNLRSGDVIFYGIDGSLYRENYDIKMIHIVSDPRVSRSVVPSIFTYYRDRWTFHQQYLAFNLIKRMHVNKTDIPTGEYIFGLKGGEGTKFVLNKEDGYFEYDYAPFLDTWYHIDEETNYIVGYSEYKKFNEDIYIKGKSVYNVASDKFIKLKSLKKGDSITFIDNITMCAVYTDFTKVDGTTFTTKEGNYELEEISNIIKLG